MRGNDAHEGFLPKHHISDSKQGADVTRFVALGMSMFVGTGLEGLEWVRG